LAQLFTKFSYKYYYMKIIYMEWEIKQHIKPYYEI